MEETLRKFYRNDAASPPSAPKTRERTVPCVFDYDDLPSFLRAYVGLKRAGSDRWSLGVWSRRLGLKGSGTLSNILAGNRTPMPEVLDKIKRDLELTDYESLYFDALAMASAKTLPFQMRNVVRNRLFELTAGKDYREVPHDSYELLSDPLALILREVVKVRDFNLDPDWILKRLRLFDHTPAQILELYEKLIRAGLLKWEAGKLVQDSRYYETPVDQPSEALKQYYERSLEINHTAVRAIDSSERHYNSITFCCDPSDLDALKELITEFNRKTLEAFDRPAGRQVYQLHVQLVPHLKEESE
jgi:uncharacterized protein (TIGR02147 family)